MTEWHFVMWGDSNIYCKCRHVGANSGMSSCLSEMTVTDRTLQRAAAIALNISWTSFLFQFSPTFFILFWHVQHSSSETIFVNLFQENSGGRTVQTEKRKERRKKVIRERWGKKALSSLEKGGIYGRWAAKVRQQQLSLSLETNLTFHPELLYFLFCTPSHIVSLLSWICKVCPPKGRHCTPEETKAKIDAVVMSGKKQKMVCEIVRPLKRSRTKEGKILVSAFLSTANIL